ncbi:MAG: MBOAT family O-acyltransferase [Collinsella sp.]|nr:MBOAT family O-acyltransferase [Collinsella sp.]
MSSFCSPLFLGAFVPIVTLLYGISPRRVRPWLLLAASYLCFMLISGDLVAMLALATTVTYVAGRVLELLAMQRSAAVAADRKRRKLIKRRYRTRMRLVIAGAAVLVIGILVYVKYLGFFSSIANGLLDTAGIGGHLVPPSIGIPIGISFYSLQALSYLLDVYRGTCAPERNLARLALYLCFFPQLMEGPIARYDQTSKALWSGAPLKVANIADGTVRIAWGAAKILLVANRVNLFVKPVFENFTQWDGTVVAVAAVLYTLQLYCDFSGTMDIVLGVGRIFGVNLPENFRQPFCSRTASEFWQRWHVTLGAWLRDYIFYPVSLAAPVKHVTSIARRHLGNRLGSTLAGGLALGSVWLINGLWHGAGWQYLFFGFYYFVLILGANLLEPAFAWLRERFDPLVSSRAWPLLQMVRTCAIVCVGEMFFRAHGLRAGFTMFHALLTNFSPTSLLDGTLLAPGMDIADFIIVGIFVLALAIQGHLREYGGSSLERFRQRPLIASSVLVASLIFCIAIFGAYGAGYIPLDPIYAQF